MEAYVPSNTKQIHTARVNLTQMSHSPSHGQFNQQKCSEISSKYGYLAGSRPEHSYSRVNSQRSTTSHSKIIGGSAAHSTSMGKASHTEKSSSVSKHKKDRPCSTSKQASFKRKKSRSRENEHRAKSLGRVKDQIMNYLEKYIKGDDVQDYKEEITDQQYEERLTILKEFIQYLEDKSIINPRTLNDSSEIKKLVSGLAKIDLSKICISGGKLGQRKMINTENYVPTKNRSNLTKADFYCDSERRSIP